MLATSSTLENLLAPLAPHLFFQENWEKQPLAIARADENHYAPLLSMRDVDAVLAYSQPRFDDQTAFEPVAPRPPTYVRGVLADQPALPPDGPSIAELRQVYEQGKSLVIMAMQRRWPSIAELCRGLEAFFHCPVHANLYLTPAGSQGFAAHFDTHEVFVLQLEGVKHWRLYGAAEELPLAADSVPLPKRPSRPTQEITLRAGDLLYLPRGHVHEASTAEIASMHLTVGVNVYRWADLLRHALTLASRRNIGFRQSIPGGALPGDASQLKATFQALLELFAQSASADGLLEQALESLGNQFFDQMKMLPCGQFGGHAEIDRIEIDTVLERNLLTLCRVVEGEKGVAIEFPGNRVGGPPRIASALRFIAKATRFTARDLPDDLSADAKLTLVRRLVREGLLRTVGQPVSDFLLAGATFSEENHANDVTTRQLAETVGHAGSPSLVR